MSVKFVRKEVVQLKPIYKMIRDVLAGPSAVKAAGTAYLPVPDPSDTSPYAAARYANYLLRAVYFDASSRTHEGFVGQIFYRETQIELPSMLEVLLKNVDGQGTTLEQQAKGAVGEVLALGRSGLYVDYTAVAGSIITLADQEKAKVRPIITPYAPERIINWRHSTIDNVKFLSLVVLEEDYEEEDDGFECEIKVQHRELRIEVDPDTNTRRFVCRVWRDGDVYLEAYPTRGDGSPWESIPFFFIGAKDNDAEVDKPPFEGMAHINIGHYRNSAEHEEIIFMAGQPTPWASGISDLWMKEHWNNELRLGTREFIPLPLDSQMGLLQINESTLAQSAMEHKEKQLVALGAKIAESKTTTTTATEENRDSVIENSTLSSVAKNTSSAYTLALQCACIYSNLPSEKVVFEINTDFEMTRMSPQDRAQLLLEWQGGGVSWTEYRWNMKRGGIAYQDDKEAKEEIEAGMEDAIDLDAKRTAAQTPEVPEKVEVDEED